MKRKCYKCLSLNKKCIFISGVNWCIDCLKDYKKEQINNAHKEEKIKVIPLSKNYAPHRIIKKVIYEYKEIFEDYTENVLNILKKYAINEDIIEEIIDTSYTFEEKLRDINTHEYPLVDRISEINIVKKSEVKEDIVQVLSNYIDLNKIDENYYTSMCPFKRCNSNLFTVCKPLQLFNCGRCRKKGNVEEFIKEIEGK